MGSGRFDHRTIGFVQGGDVAASKRARRYRRSSITARDPNRSPVTDCFREARVSFSAWVLRSRQGSSFFL